MFQFVSGTVTGIGDMLGSIYQGGSEFVSSFFPAPQKSTTTSQISEAITHSPVSYRPTIPEAASIRKPYSSGTGVNWGSQPSLSDFAGMISEGWMRDIPASPTLDPVVVHRDPPDTFLSQIISPWKKTVDEIWTAGQAGVSQINEQLPELLLQKWGILPQPESANTQGGVDIHIRDQPDKYTSTIAAAVQEQLKGLYGLFYDPNRPVGTSPIKAPAAIATGGLVVIGIVILVIILLSRK